MPLRLISAALAARPELGRKVVALRAKAIFDKALLRELIERFGLENQWRKFEMFL